MRGFGYKYLQKREGCLIDSLNLQYMYDMILYNYYFYTKYHLKHSKQGPHNFLMSLSVNEFENSPKFYSCIETYAYARYTCSIFTTYVGKIS